MRTLVQMTAFWDTTLCILVEVDRSFRGTLMIKAVSTSETSVYFHETTRRSISEDCYLHSYRNENLKSHTSWGLGIRSVEVRGLAPTMIVRYYLHPVAERSPSAGDVKEARYHSTSVSCFPAYKLQKMVSVIRLVYVFFINASTVCCKIKLPPSTYTCDLKQTKCIWSVQGMNILSQF
jgi:hypothetical protein